MSPSLRNEKSEKTPDTVTAARVQQKIAQLDGLPAVPSIVRSLFQELSGDPESLRINKIIEVISCDESLAARCLKLANAAIFGQRWRVDSIRGAVVTLGMERLRSVLLSCCAMQMTPARVQGFNPILFWEHSFACALITQRFGRKLHYGELERAYVAGLLHDTGTLIAFTLFPGEYREVLRAARGESLDFIVAEERVIGTTHCEIGRLAAEQWGFPPELQEAIAYHHHPEKAQQDPVLAACVSLAEKLCSLRGMGYEFATLSYQDFLDAPAWQILQERFGSLNRFDFARLTTDLGDFADEIRSLVGTLFTS